MTQPDPGEGAGGLHRFHADELVLLLGEHDARERVFESFPDAVILTDAGGRVRDANRAALRLLGRSAEEAFGRDVTDLVAVDPQGDEVSPLTRAGLWQGPVEVLRREGGRVPMLARSVVLSGEDEPMHLLVLAERPHDPVGDALAGAEQRLSAIVGSAMDAIVSIDRTQRIVVFNRAAEEMFGCPAAKAIGQPLERFIPERYREAHRRHVRGFAETGRSQRRMGALLGTLMGLRASGEEFPIEATISRVEGPDGPLLTAIVRDVSERVRLERERDALVERERAATAETRRIAERTRRLQAITDAALAHLSLDDLFDELLGRLRQLLGADAATVLLLDEEARVLRVRAVSGLDRPDDERNDVPLGMGVAGRIAAGRRPVVIDDLRHARPVSPFLRRRLRSLAGVPIVHEHRVIGVVHVGSVEPRSFGDEEVALLETVAARLAPAIENARLHQAERAARLAAEEDAARLRASRTLAETLSRILSLEDTAREIVDSIVPALGAIAGAVALVDEHRERLEVLASTGYPAELIERFRAFPLDAQLPLASAVRLARPVLLGSPEERDRAFPELSTTAPVGASWAALPMLLDGEPIGALGLTFRDRRTFGEPDADLMTMLAHQCAQALDRATVYERERGALRQADDARRRLALLQTLTARLSRALTHAEIAQVVVADAATALGADSGVVLLVDGTGSTFELAASQGYPPEALAGWDRFPVELDTPSGDAVRTRSVVVLSSPQDLLERYPGLRSSMSDRPMGPTAALPIVAGDRALGAIAFTFPPGREVTAADRELLSALGRHAGQALERAELYETERAARGEAERARDRIERLQTVTEALAGAETAGGVLDVLVDHGLSALGAIASLVVELRDGRTLAVVAARGYPSEMLTGWSSFSIEDRGALARAVRTRTGVWLASAEGTVDRFPSLEDTVRRLGHEGAFAAIPLEVGDRLLGAVGLQFAEPRAWDDEDREFLGAIARQCAQAWARAQLHEAELASRRELRRSERRYRSLVQATSAVEWTVDPAGGFVEPQPSWEAYTGQPWEEQRGFGWLNALHPDDRAITSARWFAARDAGAVFETECRIRHAASGEHRHTVVRAAPVHDDRGRIVEWVGTVVDVHDQRLAERASAERERASREDLRLAGERLSFLAEASTVLATSLVVDETLQRLADLAVPRLADWCVIDLVRDDGSTELVAASHVDPAKSELAWDLRRRYPPDPDSPFGAPYVVRSGRSQLVPEIPREVLDQAVREHPELAGLIDELQLRSLMVVPLGVADRMFGAISFVWAESGRTYTQEDLALAEDLAHRASVAVENARLYEAERTARAEETAAQQRLHVLAEAGAAMAASLDPRVVLSAVTRLLARELCDWSAAFLVDRSNVIIDAVGAHHDPALDPVVQRGVGIRWPDVEDTHSLVARVLRTGTQVSMRHVTPDALRRIVTSPEQRETVERLGVASVVAVPLSARGRNAGVLVAVRAASSPPFDAEDEDLLVEIGRRTALALENAQLYSEREYIADTLQQSLLPPKLPSIPGLEIGARYQPASEGTSVGGDFYDVFEIDLDHWAAVIGDVVGKGPQAAAMMGLARYTVRTAAMSESRPSRILATLNEAFLRQTSEQRFCTACCLRILRREDTARITLAAGGHPLPLLVRADGTLETAGTPGTLLGVFDDPTLEDEALDLGAGDAIVLYTDGVTDERRDREEFGERRLTELVASLAGRHAQEMADEILRAVVDFRTERPRDDIAILVIRKVP